MKDNRMRIASRKEAEEILARMNDILRVKTLDAASKDASFNELNGRIHALGWLALIKEYKSGLRVQLKLVDPASEEAKDLP